MNMGMRVSYRPYRSASFYLVPLELPRAAGPIRAGLAHAMTIRICILFLAAAQHVAVVALHQECAGRWSEGPAMSALDPLATSVNARGSLQR